MKTVCYFILFITLYSCMDQFKLKVQGDWETVRFEHFINGELQPKSEWQQQLNFETDAVTFAISDNRAYDLVELYSITEDSILFKDGTGFLYNFSGDTLIMSQLDAKGSCFHYFNLYLLPLESDKFGNFKKEYYSIEGDWSIIESYQVHKDSVDFEDTYRHKELNTDFYITDDSAYTIDNTYRLNKRERLIINGDTLLFQKENQFETYHFRHACDTLKLTGVASDGNVIKKTFIRAEFDQGEIDFLLDNLLNPKLIVGSWSLLLTTKDSIEFLKKYPDYQIIKNLNFGDYSTPCDHPDNITFIKDQLIVSINGVENRFKVDLIENRIWGCFIFQEMMLAPIINGEMIDTTLIYRSEL